MKPAASTSTSTTAVWAAAAATVLRWFGEGLLFTPLLSYCAVQRGFTRSLPMLAVENCLYFRLFAACLPSRDAAARPWGGAQRRACALALASTLVFLHSFLIASQVRMIWHPFFGPPGRFAGLVPSLSQPMRPM